MRRQDRGDERGREEVTHFPGGNSGGFNAVQSVADAPFLRGALGERAFSLLADVMLVFGNIGEMKKVAECPNHRNHGVSRQGVEKVVERFALSFVLRVGYRRLIEMDGRLADPFDDGKNGFAFLVAYGFAQQSAKKTDVVAQRQVVLKAGWGHACSVMQGLDC